MDRSRDCGANAVVPVGDQGRKRATEIEAANPDRPRCAEYPFRMLGRVLPSKLVRKLPRLVSETGVSTPTLQRASRFRLRFWAPRYRTVGSDSRTVPPPGHHGHLHRWLSGLLYPTRGLPPSTSR